jgi:prepilin-type N-terminal cleavage/methylation domain-containing protein
MVPETIMKKQEPNNPSMHQRGFTLMELMAALAVVVAMLAFVIPRLSVAARDYKLKALAKEIEEHLQNARIGAINRDKAASLIFSSDDSWYYLDTNGNGIADSGESTYWHLRAGTP